jgi:hypothetical protein
VPSCESTIDSAFSSNALAKITKRTVDALKPGATDRFLWDTELKGFGLKVTPSGNKVYILQYRSHPILSTGFRAGERMLLLVYRTVVRTTLAPGRRRRVRLFARPICA